MKRIFTARLAAFVLALAALVWARTIFYVESLNGFPDGHVTEYDHAAHGPRLALGAATLALGVWLAVSAIMGPPPGKGRRLWVAFGVLVVVAMLHAASFQGWFKPLFGLDYGQGG